MDVQVDSGITRGMSVVDKLGVAADAKNHAAWSDVVNRGRKHSVVWEMDIPGWKKALLKALVRDGKSSSTATPRRTMPSLSWRRLLRPRISTSSRLPRLPAMFRSSSRANACKALELARRTDIPVYAGAAVPLLRPLVTAEHVHGRTGFDGYELPEPRMPLQSGFAPNAIVELVMSRPPNTVTLCCTGPLTNAAMAMAREPRLATDLARDRAHGWSDVGRWQHHPSRGI